MDTQEQIDKKRIIVACGEQRYSEIYAFFEKYSTRIMTFEQFDFSSLTPSVLCLSVMHEVGMSSKSMSKFCVLLLRDYDILPQTASDFVSTLKFWCCQRILDAKCLLFDRVVRTVLQDECWCVHDNSVIEIFRRCLMHLSEDSLCGLLEFGAFDSNIEVIADAYIAAIFKRSHSFMLALINHIAAANTTTQFEVMHACGSDAFAHAVCQSKSGLYDFLDLLHFQFNPNMICRVCMNSKVNVKAIEYLLTRIDCSKLTFILQGQSVFHFLVQTYLALTLDIRQEKQDEFIAVIHILLKSGANPNLWNTEYKTAGNLCVGEAMEKMHNTLVTAQWQYCIRPSYPFFALLLCVLEVEYFIACYNCSQNVMFSELYIHLTGEVIAFCGLLIAQQVSVDLNEMIVILIRPKHQIRLLIVSLFCLLCSLVCTLWVPIYRLLLDPSHNLQANFQPMLLFSVFVSMTKFWAMKNNLTPEIQAFLAELGNDSYSDHFGRIYLVWMFKSFGAVFSYLMIIAAFCSVTLYSKMIVTIATLLVIFGLRLDLSFPDQLLKLETVAFGFSGLRFAVLSFNYYWQ